jgi:hypothetical protein
VKKLPKFFDYNVYVACSLTHASPEFRAVVESFKDELGLVCNIIRFAGLASGRSPREIYMYDIHECVGSSDLVVAICDHPSIGLGYEIATQLERRGMPCLCIAHENSHVTEFILDVHQPGFEFKRYKDLQKEGVEMVLKKLKKMEKMHKTSKLKETV